MVCSTIGYHTGSSARDSYVLFRTQHGEARFYSLTALVRKLGQAYSRANRIEDLKSVGKGEWRQIEPLRLSVSRKERDDGTSYLLVTDITKTDRLDEILEGGE